MQTAAPGLSVLSALVTPAILILASGSLLATTSQRMGRVVERTRGLADALVELARRAERGDVDGENGAIDERVTMFELLGRATRRARLLQRAMLSIYVALGIFVATSVMLGVLSALDREHTWVAIPLAVIGVGLLLHATVLLIFESRATLAAADIEMRYALRRASAGLPREIVRKWVRDQREHGSIHGPLRGAASRK